MNFLRRAAVPLLSVLLTCFFPCAFLFCQNAGEAAAVDMLPFFCAFILLALVLFLALDILFRNVGRACLVTDLAMLVVINYTLLLNTVQRVAALRSRYLLCAVCVLLLLLVGLLFWKKPNVVPLCGVVAIVFGALILVNFLTAAPTIVAKATFTKSAVSAEDAAAQVDFLGKKRNVYYFLFDEYGGQENLRHYFDYDDEAFLAQLEGEGFSVSRSSHNPESCWTDTLLANLLNLSYITDDSLPLAARDAYTDCPLLYQMFAQNGYQINLVNHLNFLGTTGCNVLTHGQARQTISQYLYENSLFSQIPVVSAGIETYLKTDYYIDSYRGTLDDAISSLRTCWQYAQNGPTLTVAYLQCPHAPFAYSALGEPLNIRNGWNWRDKGLYLGQLQYISTVIRITVADIQKNDPDAVMILQSDHGARYPLHLVEQYGGPAFDSAAETPFMQNCLNCVYLPGQTLEIAGLTGINTLRAVLNTAFGTELPMLDPPSGYAVSYQISEKNQDRTNAKESAAVGSGGARAADAASTYEEKGKKHNVGH